MATEAIQQLEREECIALLASCDVGQLAITRRALPSVVPARYVVHGARVLIHVAGFTHAPWRDGEVVALHVYSFDDGGRVGWSVSVTGRAHGSPALYPDQEAPRAPWIPQGGGDLIAISTDLIAGERLGPPGTTAPRTTA